MITNASEINTRLNPMRTLLTQNEPVTSIKTQSSVTELETSDNTERPSIREAFDDFVGQSFYGQLIGSMRKTVGKPAYLHGGRSEEIFQSQMDQQLAEHMSDATASSFTGPMFDLFSLPRP
jgi:hypothetical protein